MIDSTTPAVTSSSQTGFGASNPSQKAGITTAIAFLCLGVWWLSPLFPDEFALRQVLGRFIFDNGVIHGLWALCPSNFKTVPFVFTPFAWLLAQALNVFSPQQMRILSFAAVLAVVFFTSLLAAKNRNAQAGLIVLASFSGVAGSGLIFTRYEFPLELHLLSCLVAALWLKRSHGSLIGDLGVGAGLLFGAGMSTWAHPQGLLLLPLSSFLLWRIGFRRIGYFALVAAATPWVLFVPAASRRFHAVCVEQPLIEAVFRSLALNSSDLRPDKLAALLVEDARTYVESFLYASSYPIGYLPGINKYAFLTIPANAIVLLSLLVLGGALLFIIFNFCKICVLIAPFRPKKLEEFVSCGEKQELILGFLISALAVTLFVFDKTHAFYRHFYINHLTAVAAALTFSTFPRRRPVDGIRGIAVIVAVTSLIANSILFVPKLWNFYEGPSLSMFRDWSQVRLDTEALTRQCHMDLARGRIFVDDLTQAAVFRRPITFSFTWVAQQAAIVGMSIPVAVKSVKPNYAILRCPYFNYLDVKPQGQSGELCCYNFESAP